MSGSAHLYDCSSPAEPDLRYELYGATLAHEQSDKTSPGVVNNCEVGYAVVAPSPCKLLDISRLVLLGGGWLHR